MSRIMPINKFKILRMINQDTFLCNNIYDKNKLQIINSVSILLYILSTIATFVYTIFGFYWQSLSVIYLLLSIHIFWHIKKTKILWAKIFGSQSTLIFFFISSMLHGYPTILTQFYIPYIVTVPLFFGINEKKFIILFIVQSSFLFIVQQLHKDWLINLNKLPYSDLEKYNFVILCFLIIYLFSMTLLFVILNKYHENKQRQIKSKLYNIKNRLSAHNKELQTFGMAVTHSLKTPLFIIKNFLNKITYIIKENKQSHHDSIDYYLKLIKESNVMNEKYSNDLLSYSSLYNISDNYKAVYLHDFVSKIISIFLIKYTNVNIINNIDNIIIETNELALEIIIENLIDNSIKYNKEETPIVKVYSKKNDDKKISILIEDNGIGIKEDFRKKIFDPFTRINEIESTLGSGMGLFITKQAASKINSSIKLLKSDQSGSIFEIKINNAD